MPAPPITPQAPPRPAGPRSVPTLTPFDQFPATGEGVTAALAALGTSPDRIAELLAAVGFLGEPGEARECPIAVYLRAVLTPTWPVSVGEATATVWRTGHRVDVALPGPVRRFVAAFDLGAYRFLHPAGYTDPETTRDSNPDSGAGTSGRPVDPMARSRWADTSPDITPDNRADSRPDTATDHGEGAP